MSAKKFDSFVAEWVSFVKNPNHNLIEKCLKLAQILEYPELDISKYIQKIHELGNSLKLKIGVGKNPTYLISMLNEYLFEECGFLGNEEDYYDPGNSFLNVVLDKKTGIPITISIIYSEIAKYVGLDLRIVGFPGHVIVKYKDEIILDPFYHGILLTIEDLEENNIFFLSRIIKKLKPDIVFAGFDIGANFASAIIGAHMNIPVVHLEGGEVTGTIDESIRHATSKFAHIHFTTNLVAKQRLVKMGEDSKNIFIVGNPSLDAIKNVKNIPVTKLEKEFKLDIIKNEKIFKKIGIKLNAGQIKKAQLFLRSALNKGQDISKFLPKITRGGAAAIDYSLFHFLFGVPSSEAALGASGWLTKSRPISDTILAQTQTMSFMDEMKQKKEEEERIENALAAHRLKKSRETAKNIKPFELDFSLPEEFAGGGMAGIRRPSALPPTGGPQSQGLASLKKYGSYY